MASVLWAGLATSWGVGAEVTLTTDLNKAYLNEPFLVRITVQGFQECEPPEFPASEAYTARQAGPPAESSSYTNINGRTTVSRSRVYGYEFTPRQIGDLVVPPVRVKVDGRTLETKPVRIAVQASDADQLFWVEATAGRKRIYVGQRVPLTLSMWVKPARYGTQLLDAGTMLRQLQLTEEGLRPFRPPIRSSQRRRAGDDAETVYYVYEMTSDFVAERAGPLTLDSIQVGVSYPGRGGAPRQLRARVTGSIADVLPVPMEGRPADFNGAVGLFDIEVAATPTNVRVGDPIELTIEIFGDGPVESLPPPLLTANRQLNEDFRVPAEKLAGDVRNARRRFSVTIRPTHEGVTAVPAIEYPYFDPDAERFVVAHSKPIPLSVAPAAEAAPPQLPGGPAAQPRATGDALQPLDGLRDIETSEPQLLAAAHPVTAGLVTTVTLVPPAAFLLTWAVMGYVQRQRGDVGRQRRQGALRAARRRITHARARPAQEMAHEVAAALTGYLADRLDEPPARFTGRAALDFLQQHGVAPDVIERWADVIARCEEAAFAGGTQTDTDALARQALGCLAALERQKL